jgi:hypothetical protein
MRTLPGVTREFLSATRAFSRVAATLSLFAAGLPLATTVRAEEGKWTPQQVLQLDPKWLKQQGLELPVSRLWDPQRGTGLLAAAISVPGCSASFVSSSGLVLTNHHCLFSLIQEHTRPDRDLITNGFLARTREEELPGKTMRVTIPRKFTDVTKQIEASVPAGAEDLARSKAIEAKQKALVAACEKATAGNRCNVSAFDGGLQYVLIETFELTDVRLVYAPPRAIGEFGGEPDNFRWPRHVGDFSMARVYKDGKPYTPEFFFPLAKDGVKPGDFVMVLGYPGRTFRSLTADEMQNERRFRFELAHEIFGRWIELLEQTTKGSDKEAGRIAVAATLKSLNNTNTNAQGQLAGIERGKLIDKQRANDEAVATWAAGKPEFAKALNAKKGLDTLAEERRRNAVRDYLLNISGAGSVALRHSLILVHQASERQQPDAEREPGYQDRDQTRVRNQLEREQKNFFLPADQALLADWLTRAKKERIEAAVNVPDPDAAAERMLASTKVTDIAERLKMYGETPAQLHARNDPLLEFAFTLDPELRAFREQTNARDGAVGRLRPDWRRAVIAHAGKPVAADANGTLRVSFAHVKGYSPRDGVYYQPQTTVAGMIEKNTGEDPFEVPKFILDAVKKDPKAGQVPLDFLADADTTGGNSGSPVVNGKGEIVGLNFDRPWENVANDFGYNPDVARNISVDLRFLRWLLDDVQHADNLLVELGWKKAAAAGAARTSSAQKPAPASDGVPFYERDVDQGAPRHDPPPYSVKIMSANAPLSPPKPSLNLILSATVKIDAPQMVGKVLTGERRVVPITGGTFQGPKLQGEILPVGADWQVIAADGTAQLDARYTLKTNDGALIYVRNIGIRHGPPEVLAAIARGERVDPSSYYFRASPTFETGDPRYQWLNKIIAVCSAVRTKEAVILDFYEVK